MPIYMPLNTALSLLRYLPTAPLPGAFEELESDIDLIVLTCEEWTASELAQLNALHTQLMGASNRWRLEVLYIPLRDLGNVIERLHHIPLFDMESSFLRDTVASNLSHGGP